MLICLFPHCSSKSGRRAPYALTSLEVEVAGELEGEKLLACTLTSAPYCETRTKNLQTFVEFPKTAFYTLETAGNNSSDWSEPLWATRESNCLELNFQDLKSLSFSLYLLNF
jgi:hypothetical protein